MSNKNYWDYLESPEWWARKKEALRRASYRCERQVPGGPHHEGPLEVHHKNYLHLGDEPLDDLEVLCHVCHQAERLPKNKRQQALELRGQVRLFDRWAA